MLAKYADSMCWIPFPEIQSYKKSECVDQFIDKEARFFSCWVLGIDFCVPDLCVSHRDLKKALNRREKSSKEV